MTLSLHYIKKFAFLHQTANRFVDGNAVENKNLFAGLADVGDQGVHGGLI